MKRTSISAFLIVAWFALVQSSFAQLPGNWLDTDIGTVTSAGSATYATGTFTLQEQGTNGISGIAADKMHFAYQPLTGDGSIVARVSGLQGSTTPQVGIMIRETLSAGSTYAFLIFQPNAASFSYRATTGTNNAYQMASFTSSAYPYWLKLIRSGNTFTGYVSKNAVDWTQIGTGTTIVMASNVYIGLMAATGSTGGTETATFDSVSISSATTPAPTITGISATTGFVGSQVQITGINFGLSQASGVVMLNGSPVPVNSWSDTSIQCTIPTGATSGLLLVLTAPSENGSNAVYFTVTGQPLPSGWLDQDIGTPSTAGSATFANGVFTLNGAGGITGVTDSLHFAYQALTGDGSIIARVNTAQPYAVLMIRQSLAANSPEAYAEFSPNVASFYSRATAGTSPASQSIAFTASAPYWLKLVRSGNSFTGYVSKNGFDWTQIGASPVSVTMTPTVCIGLGLAGSTAVSDTFDNVSVSSTADPAPVITALSATTGSVGTQIQITGTNFGTTPGSLVTLNGTPLTLNTWSDTSIVCTVPVGAASGSLIVSVAPSMNSSNAVYFNVTSQPLPPGWLDQDIGTPSTPGSATYSNGAFTVAGAGSFTGTADSLHFVYQTLTGDGSITARVNTVQVNPVLMIRQSLAANSLETNVSFYPNAAYQYSRTTAGATPTSQAVAFSASAPYWLKLARTGNTFTGYVSKNGTDWTQIGTAGVTVNMTAVVYIGFGLASGSTSASDTFDNVSVSSMAVPPPLITGISSTTASVGTQVQITGTNFGASQAGSLIMLNGTPATTDFWSDGSVIFTIPTGATSGPVLVLKGPSMNSSNAIYLTVTANPLPGPWLDGDLGAPSTVGSASFSSGTFTIAGSGSIGGTADSFHFVYQTLAGDGSITARISSLTAGSLPVVMIRETLNSNSADAYISFAPNQATLSWRATTGAMVSSQAVAFSSPTYPYWLKLVRNGNTFVGYVSSNGTTWTQAGTGTASMASNVYIGLGVAKSGGLGTVTFDNVSVAVGTTPYVSSVSPLIAGVGSSVTITGSNFGDTQGTSVVNFNGTVATSTSWSSSQIVATVPSNVASGTGPVTVVVNSVESPANVMFTAINPILTSIVPPGAAPGANVTVNGTGITLSGQPTRLSLNGTDISFEVLSQSSTSMTFQVPTGPTSGPLIISVGSVQSNPLQFTVEGRPTITGVSPTSGLNDAWPITISGSGFGATQSSSTLTFYGSSPATIISWSDTAITAVVPDDAVTGPVTITVGGISSNGPWFYINSITDLTDSLGNESSYTSAIIGGHWVASDSQGPGCSSCTMRGNEHDVLDSKGNLLSTTDALGHTTTYGYDANNNVTSTSQQLDANDTATTSYTYNSFGEVLTSTDPLGNTTTNTYDANGNLLSVTTPAPDGNTAASVTQFQYDSKGELTQITDPMNHPTTLTYTPAGLIATITDAQGNVTTYGYDARGDRTSVTDALHQTTTFVFDIMGRLTGITYPDSSTVSFGYDSRGRRTSATDQNGKTTTYAYDDADRLTAVTDPVNHTTQYAYDTEDNLTGITDANGHVTSFSYDAFDRVTQTAFPSSYAESYAYDAIGNLTSKTDRNGQTIQYVYDALNRLTQKNYPDSTSVDYVYDLVGKIKQVTDPTGVYGFAYDNMGRLIGTTTQYSFLPNQTFTNSYTYDAASNRTGFTAPDGSTNSYQYDSVSRLANLTSSFSGQFTFGYDGIDNETSLSRPNGVNTSYNYDSLSNLVSVLHQAGPTIDGATYNYDNARNSISQTNELNNITDTYGYDALYRLTEVTQGTTTTESYTYDLVGNRLSSIDVPLYSYNSSNELTSDSSGSYTYDANGNMLTKPDGTRYGWDFDNHLLSVALPTGDALAFKYDPFGRRIQKLSTHNGTTTTTNYIYDHDNQIDNVDSTGNVVAKYTQGLDVDEHLSLFRAGNTSYYEQDALGSVTSISNGTGTLVNTYIYNSFGRLTNSSGTINNPFQYTGRELDSETGLYYYRARYYDPSIGRFINEDPVRFFAGINFYSYVNNNPTNNIDPSGKTSIPIPIYGNWCGPNWTGGHFEEYDPAHDRNGYYKRPTDKTDQVCVEHDKCYYRCRRDDPCDKTARAGCMRVCDDVLIGNLLVEPPSFWNRIVADGIDFINEHPDPGDNANSCACKANTRK